MKKGSSLKSFIEIITAVAILLFTYVASVTEIKRMNRQKISKQDSLNVKLNLVEGKMVEIQKWTAEDRIVVYAQDSIGLIRPSDNLETISVSKDQIKQIEKLLNQKYD
ncbi:MAG: hypothetical protein D4R68_05170 [Ignavibacteriales bacterium]|nr:MAG: hypothetical protein D4R68_05170 [Ignavibacteriales bacterium]